MLNSLKKFLTKKILIGKDTKPITVTALLAKDACSRLLAEYSEKDLKTCNTLVIVWQTVDGDIFVQSSENLDGISAIGLLSVAQGMIKNDQT